TPPGSHHESTQSTQNLDLSLQIPGPEALTAADKRSQAARKAAATRQIPKLQDPFPTKTEIRNAYDTKLLRHYPAATPTPAPQRLTPIAEKSTRVMNLLKNFPKLQIPARGTTVSVEEVELDKKILNENRAHTAGDNAVASARKNFAVLDPVKEEGQNRGYMVESGLDMDDLEDEKRGIPNKLPEWKKWATGR
ncbi:hypothetical protein K469DRAFT_500516, partial [Zopfia rhizophila CBS 207.26]